MNEAKYVEMRKRNLKEMFNLLENRRNINRKLRSLRKTMEYDDRSLIAN